MKKNKLWIAVLSLAFVTATFFAAGGTAVSAEDDDLIDIGEDVTTIGDFAFDDCCSFTTITIPEGITYIGRDAFYGCAYVTDLF